MNTTTINQTKPAKKLKLKKQTLRPLQSGPTPIKAKGPTATCTTPPC